MKRISGRPVSIYRTSDNRWRVPAWGWVEDRKFDEIVHFETAIPYNPESPLFRSELERKIKWSYGSTIYQFNALSNDLSYLRMVAVLHNSDPVNRIHEVSWFDACVKYPFLKGICWVANQWIGFRKKVAV